MTFTVPQIPASPTGRAYIWGGLGGDGRGRCPHTERDRPERDGATAQYHAFREYAPNLGQDVSNFSVRPGDLVESYAYPTDANFNWNAVGTYGCFGFNNITQGTTSSGSELCAHTNSKAPPFAGATAEFIIEPAAGPVSNVHNFEVDGYAWAAGGRCADMSTDPYTLQQLTNEAGTKTLVQMARLNNDGIQMFWLSGNR